METHIGIVGTEAKINQEELVKSRRKIWSLPLALVTALLLVGMLGAIVLAVGAGDAPEEGAQIPDQTLTIGPTGALKQM